MSDKDPPPFGYTFSGDFFQHGAATPLDKHGQSLLSDMEGQSLADFFSNTDPFSLSDPQPFGPAADSKLAANDFSDWAFMAPPTVHQVSATVPDQAQLHHGFHPDDLFAHHPLPLDPMGTTHDDLQAASTLFHNAHHPAPALFPLAPGPFPLAHTPSASHSHGPRRHAHDDTRSYAHDAHHHTHDDAHHHTHDDAHHTHDARPMAAASQGLLNEQLAAHWSAPHRPQDDFAPAPLRPPLKRTYTFGTDDSFSNPAAFSAPHNETEEQVTRRLMRDTRTLSYMGHMPPAPARPAPRDDATDDDSEDTSSADDSPPSKKRKKSFQSRKESIRKTAPPTRVSKPKKPADADSKKKRASAAAQKLQRENLSEEQKRSNHILSEQKRRNLIKRGFDDLHDLVPEIRTGGLSKSSVLMEAANFLDKLIADNLELIKLVRDGPAG